MEHGAGTEAFDWAISPPFRNGVRAFVISILGMSQPIGLMESGIGRVLRATAVSTTFAVRGFLSNSTIVVSLATIAQPGRPRRPAPESPRHRFSDCSRAD